jgi:hypothetical protein
VCIVAVVIGVTAAPLVARQRLAVCVASGGKAGTAGIKVS